jgi:hypothetical protein
MKARLAFPALFAAKSFGGEGEAAFSGSFILTPDSPSLPEVNKAIEAAAKEKWGPKADAILKELRAKGKVCLGSGDEKASYDGFEGNMFVSASSKTRPTVLDRDKSPLVEADGRPYAGCFVNAKVNIWAQDNQFGKRINATLMGVQFHSDGDAFAGGRVASPDDFDDLSEGAEEGALA